MDVLDLVPSQHRLAKGGSGLLFLATLACLLLMLNPYCNLKRRPSLCLRRFQQGTQHLPVLSRGAHKPPTPKSLIFKCPQTQHFLELTLLCLLSESQEHSIAEIQPQC